MMHATEPVGHGYPGKGTATPERLLVFIIANPALPIVLAHWGGGLPFYELMPEVASACALVAYDTAASTYLYRPAVFRAVLDIVGPRRVLWGSDYPVLGMDRFLRKTIALGEIRDDELEAVLSGTARRVYGFEGGETA
jgi:predicted TIM-barrel fold metal-dependent hydrolase